MLSCPSAGRCGGCNIHIASYEEHLAEKERNLRKILRAADLEQYFEGPVSACPDRFHYRNKMEYSFGNESIGTPLELGLHAKGRYMSVVYAGACLIAPEDFNKIVNAVRDFAREKAYDFYHRKRHEGLLRHLILRRGVRTNEILMNIVTTGGSFDEEEFLRVVLGAGTEARICGVLRSIDESVSDAIKPESVKVLYGEPYYTEQLLGLDFKVGPFSFFQTNVPAAERLYADAIGLIEGLKGKIVYDLYCGTGTITQALATKASKVYGVEIVEEAVEAARENAAINGLSNCEFICGDVLTALDDIEALPDIIVVDPPRSGIHPKAMKKIASYGVDQLVYISCNPKTMVENLQTAIEASYEVKTIRAYDNFAFTRHTEAVSLLFRTEGTTREA